MIKKENKIFHEINRYYTPDFLKEMDEKYNSKSFFASINKILVGDMVFLSDPLNDIIFLGTKWEISGDYCVFNCIEKNEKSITLQPTEDMLSRADRSPMNSSEWNIKITNKLELLLVIRKNDKGAIK